MHRPMLALKHPTLTGKQKTSRRLLWRPPRSLQVDEGEDEDEDEEEDDDDKEEEEEKAKEEEKKRREPGSRVREAEGWKLRNRRF